ncbi:MAG: response regulator [Cellvibrionaceae bacterium]|nr:response regulator [Cellvibrionaceae bacterium]
MNSGRSIRFFVALRTAPWLMAFIVIASIVLIFFARALINSQLDDRHDNRINHFEENLQRTLNGLQDQVSNVANNDLIVNSIVDFQERKNYIPLFIRSFSFSGIENSDIAITDFSGNIIFKNAIGGNFLIDNVPDWKESVLDKGESFLSIDDTLLTVASPIFFADSTEGAVIASIKLMDLKKALSINYIDGDIIYIAENNRVIYSSNDNVLTVGDIYRSDNFDAWFVSYRKTKNGYLIVSLESKNSFYENLYIVFLFLAVASSIAIIGSIMSIFLSSGLISTTLTKLLLSLDQIKSKGVSGVNFLNEKDPDELKSVLKKYSVLIKDLSETQVLSRNMKGIIHSLNEYLVVFDNDGTTKLTNNAFDRFLGEIESEEKNDFSKIIPLALRETALTTNHPMLDFEQVYSTCPIIFGVDSDDKSVIRWSRSLYYSDTGELEGLIFIGMDVTKTREIERALSDKNRAIKELSWRFDFALEAAGIGVWDYNMETGELIWDERMYKLYQITEGVFNNDYDAWTSRLHPDDIAKVNTHFSQCVQSGEDFIENFRICWPTGQWRWITAHARVVTDEQGSAIRVIGTNRDISERTQLTEDLQNALLKAEESAQLKSAFLASMSHEIRTPMNGVLGMLQLLRDTDLSKKQAHYISLARFSAESLLDLINDILDFSKVEAGKLELDCIDYNLPEMLGDLAESMAYRAQEKGLELIFDFSRITTTMVVGDSGRLRQILTNLLSNSIKFTDAGEVVLRAGLVAIDDGQWRFEASVRDTGIGIPSDKVHGLFDSFSQVDASTTRKYGGTGLGLAIVKQLCQLMGGDVVVTSSLNQGSEFSFTILVSVSEQAVALLPAFSLDNWQLLVVDDNRTNGSLLKGQLQQWGAFVTVADTANEAMTLLTEHQICQYKAVLIDGEIAASEQLCADIRADTRFDGMHLVMMTSMGKRIEAQLCNDLGLSYAFPKPATPQDLLDALAVINTDVKSTLLMVESKEDSFCIAAPIDGRDSPSQAEVKKPHLLLVEDNEINQEVALGILGVLEMTADVANNGVEALAALRKTDYDLVLMDCQMPEMDGYEATRAIRAGQAACADIIIIAMTANAMKGDRENCIAAGMNDYLTKPIDPVLLSNRLDYWLSTPLQTQPEAGGTTMNDNTSLNSIWDREDFMKRVMNNETIANKLITLFKTDTPKTIADLEQAVEAEKAEDAGLLAHKLKGSVSNLGGIELAALAHKIETAGKAADLDGVKTLWPEIRPQYAKLLQAIEQGSVSQSS